MIIIYDNICNYCGSCVAVCPENVINLMDLRLEIDNSGCTDCYRCVKGCPVGALALDRNNKKYYPKHENRSLIELTNGAFECITQHTT